MFARKLLIVGLLTTASFSTAARADGNAVVGAILGGTVGAVIGHGIGGQGGGVVGGIIGAATGASIANSNRYDEDRYYGPNGSQRVVVSGQGYYASPPVVYAQPRVEYAPQVIYSRAPVIYAPAPVYRPGYVVRYDNYRGRGRDQWQDRRDWEERHEQRHWDRDRDGRGDR